MSLFRRLYLDPSLDDSTCPCRGPSCASACLEFTNYNYNAKAPRYVLLQVNRSSPKYQNNALMMQGIRLR